MNLEDEEMTRKVEKKIPAADEAVAAIGRRIAAFRKERGITQVELAARLGVTQGSLSQYEIGQARVVAEMLLKIARELRVSADELLGLKAARTSNQIHSRKIARRMASLDKLPHRKQAAILQTIDLALSGAQK